MSQNKVSIFDSPSQTLAHLDRDYQVIAVSCHADKNILHVELRLVKKGVVN